MPSLKPAYLIHGDDHGRIAERRAGLRALAERESGAGGLQMLEGDAATPEAAAAALSSMTLTPGRRFIVVDGVERWKEKDLGPLAEALATPPPETTIAFFAREDSRASAPAALATAVKRAGGDVAEERRVQNSACSSTRAPPRHWSRRSASASSGCCASSRSSASSWARAHGSTPKRSTASLPARPSAGPGRWPISWWGAMRPARCTRISA